MKKYVLIALMMISIKSYAQLTVQTINNNLPQPNGNVEISLDVESLVTQNIIFKNTSNQTIFPNVAITGPDASLFRISINRCVSVGPGKTCQVSVSSSRKIAPRVDLYQFTVAGLPFFVSVKKAGSNNPIPDIDLLVFQAPETEINFLSTDRTKNLSFSLKNTGNKDTSAISLTWQSNNISNSKILINRCTAGLKVGKSCSVIISVPKVSQDVVESLQAAYGTNPQYSFQQQFKFNAPVTSFLSRLMEIDLSFAPSETAQFLGLDGYSFRSHLADNGKIYGATISTNYYEEGGIQTANAELKVSTMESANTSATSSLFSISDLSVFINEITGNIDQNGVKVYADDLLNIFYKNSKIDILVNLRGPYNLNTNFFLGSGFGYFRFNLDGTPDLSFGNNGVKVYFWPGLSFGDNDTKRIGNKVYFYGYVRINEPLPQNNGSNTYLGSLAVFDENGNLDSNFNRGPWEISGENGSRSRIEQSPGLYSQIFRPVASPNYVHRPGVIIFESLDKEIDPVSGDLVPEYEPEIEDINVDESGKIFALVSVDKEFNYNVGGQQANRIYEIDSNGRFLRSVKINQLDGRDSRTLTRDHNGDFYIDDRNYDENFNSINPGILKLTSSLIVDSSFGINGVIPVPLDYCDSLIYDNNKLLCVGNDSVNNKFVVSETNLEGYDERTVELVGQYYIRSSRVHILPDATILIDLDGSWSVFKIK